MMHFIQHGLAPEKSALRLIWAHGWGHDHRAFLAMAETLGASATHILFDFPGFGQTPQPSEAWGVGDYAQRAADFLTQRPFKGKTIWVGHSFGCRVGIKLAAHNPDLIDGLFLIAGAGVPRRRSLLQKLNNSLHVYTFKALKVLWHALGRDVDTLRARFGSADYRSAGPMRGTFLKVINENLSQDAERVTCPTTLLYGRLDTETPPNIGQTLHQLIKQSELVVLDEQDHYSVLSSGRHQSIKQLQNFIRKVSP